MRRISLGIGLLFWTACGNDAATPVVPQPDAPRAADAPVQGGADAPVQRGNDAPVQGGTDAPVQGDLDAPLQGGADAPTASDAPAGSASYQPNPWSVQPAFAAPSSSVQATIDDGGGTLAVTDAAGTRYALTVPPGALVEPVALVLTPLDSLAGAPAGARVLGGVHIEPEDTLFSIETTLVATPAAAPNDGLETYGYQFYGAGTSFHLVPALDSAFTVLVWSGGTAGLVDMATSDAVAFAGQAFPQSSLDGLTQLAAVADATAALPAKSGGTSDLSDSDTLFFARAQYDGTLAVGFDSGIRSDLMDASLRRRAIAPAASRFKKWLAALTTGRLSNGTRLIDHPDIRPLVAEGWMLLANAYIETIQRALDSCKMEGKPGQAYVADFWIKQGRANVTGASLPSSVATPFNATLNAAHAQADSCPDFSIDFDSDLTVSGTAATTFHIVVSASGFIDVDGPLPLNPGVFTLTPIKCGRFDNVTHRASSQGLWQLTVRVGDTIDIDEERLNNVTSVTLDYTPGITSAGFTLVDTCGSSPPQTVVQPLWYAAYLILHQAQLSPTSGLFSISTWDGGIGFGANFALKSYAETYKVGSVSMSGTSTIKVRHTPQ